MLGGGGLVAANVVASATEEGGTDSAQTLSTPAGTIDCPDVGTKLTNVPEGAKEDVAKELALLDQQIARLVSLGRAERLQFVEFGVGEGVIHFGAGDHQSFALFSSSRSLPG